MAETLPVKTTRKPRVKKNNSEPEIPHVPKKRGRKPKGGKIVKKELNIEESIFDNQVIILHLKCKLNYSNNSLFDNIDSQMNYNTDIIKEVKAYSNEDNENFSNFNSLKNEEVEYNVVVEPDKFIQDKEILKEKQRNKKNIQTKLKELELLFNNNNAIRKSSDCFWCTCDFTTSPIYIPSLHYKEKYEVYGCFCSPECAASYLFKENVDNNTKFERYQLLNYIYGKVYGYKKEIKFAPNPHYMLDKYYGNMSIQEYRQLLEYDRLILIIDKPISKIFPEIHEDNNEFETLYESKFSLKKGVKPDKSDVLNSVFSVSKSG